MIELSKADRKIIKTSFKAFRKNRVEDYLHIRQLLKERIEEVAHNGMIGIDWDCMDCDCVRWGGHSTIPATVTHFIAWENDFYEGAEGPQSGLIVEPRDDTGVQYHRDLAMEAFEDGHQHIVYM